MTERSVLSRVADLLNLQESRGMVLCTLGYRPLLMSIHLGLINAFCSTLEPLTMRPQFLSMVIWLPSTEEDTRS